MPSNTNTKPTQKSLTEFTAFVNSGAIDDRQMLRRIESLSVSADAKALLADLLKLTTTVGDAVLRVGRKILDFVLKLLAQFPHLGFAVVIAMVVGAILSLVPAVGALLATTLTPLALALGIVWGANKEVQSGDLDKRIREFVNHFSDMSQ